MKYLFLAEKPSLRRDVESCYKKHKQEIINKVGEIEFISLVGHACQLFEPNDYSNEDWDKPWDSVNYPMIPSVWGIKPIEKSKKILHAIKTKMNQFDGFIVGTDSDTEGYGIFYLIEHYLHAEKKKALRFIEHSLTDKEILEQLLCMRDYHTDPVHIRFTQSFVLRSRADWLYGMNATRMMSNKLQRLMNVGRVKGPTIKLVYDNSMAIENFKPRIYYQLVANYGSFKALYIDNNGKPVEYGKAEECLKNISLTGIVVKKEVKDVYTHAPKLYDLSALQSDAGRLFGYSPSETLDIAQSLYEVHKVISYPRTQCRYISTERAKDFVNMLKKASVFPDLNEKLKGISRASILQVQKDKQIVNDKEVETESHDALLPTSNTPDISKMDEREKNICHLIFTRLVSQFLPQLHEQKTKLFIKHGNHLFYTTGKMVADLGWRALYGTLKNIELPLLNEGDTVTAKQIAPVSKTTTPPKRLTQSSLGDAMKNIANLIEDKELRASLAESNGIGTSATRGKTITDIIDFGFVDDIKGKLYITDKGKQYIEHLNGIDIIYPEFAAIIDYEIKQIQRGEKDFQTVYQDVLKKLNNLCQKINSMESAIPKSSYRCPNCGEFLKNGRFSYQCEKCKLEIRKNILGVKLDEPTLDALFDGNISEQFTFTKKDSSTFSARLVLTKEGIKFDFSSGIKCPNCGKDMRLNKGGCFCECGVKIFRNVCGKSLTDGQIKRLIDKGRLPEINGFKKKSGETFSGTLIFDLDRGVQFSQY